MQIQNANCGKKSFDSDSGFDFTILLQSLLYGIHALVAIKLYKMVILAACLLTTRCRIKIVRRVLTNVTEVIVLYR